MLHSQIKHVHTYRPGIYHFQKNKMPSPCAHRDIYLYHHCLQKQNMNITQSIYRIMDQPYNIHKLKYYTEIKINELFLMHQYR